MKHYRSMSDIRTKLLLGTSIGAVAMIFVIAAGFGAIQFNTSATETGLIMGHVTVMAVHPDGSTSYSQSDNLILDAGRNEAFNQLFNGSRTDASGEFDCMRLGNATTPALADVGLTESTMILPISCDDDNEAKNAAFANDCTGTSSTVADLVTVFDAITAPDLNADGSNTLTESLLMQDAATSPGGGTTNTIILSHALLGTPVSVVLGTEVTLTYTMTLSCWLEKASFKKLGQTLFLFILKPKRSFYLIFKKFP